MDCSRKEVISSVSALLAVLRENAVCEGYIEVRDVFRSTSGRYYVSWGGGEVAAATVREAVELGDRRCPLRMRP